MATPTSTAFERARFRQLFRNQVHDQIVRLFLEQKKQRGLTQKMIAERMEVHPSRINRLLGDPANLTLDTISDLLLAMNAVMICEARHFEEPLTSPTTPDVAALLADFSDEAPKPRTRTARRTELSVRPEAAITDR